MVRHGPNHIKAALHNFHTNFEVNRENCVFVIAHPYKQMDEEQTIMKNMFLLLPFVDISTETSCYSQLHLCSVVFHK